VQIALVCVGLAWLAFSINFIRRHALRRLELDGRQA
jgi:hypothetical protein